MKLLWILVFALCFKHTITLKLQVKVAMKAGNKSEEVKKNWRNFIISVSAVNTRLALQLKNIACGSESVTFLAMQRKNVYGSIHLQVRTWFQAKIFVLMFQNYVLKNVAEISGQKFWPAYELTPRVAKLKSFFVFIVIFLILCLFFSLSTREIRETLDGVIQAAPSGANMKGVKILAAVTEKAVQAWMPWTTLLNIRLKKTLKLKDNLKNLDNRN